MVPRPTPVSPHGSNDFTEGLALGALAQSNQYSDGHIDFAT